MLIIIMTIKLFMCLEKDISLIILAPFSGGFWPVRVQCSRPVASTVSNTSSPPAVHHLETGRDETTRNDQGWELWSRFLVRQGQRKMLGIYLVANYPRIVSGLVHPSDLHGISMDK